MTIPILITPAIAKKVLATVDAGLSSGLGEPIPGQMCVEAAVNFALGRDHGDDPGCVMQDLRRLKIALNDKAWSSPKARAIGLRRLALAQLGSLGTVDPTEFRRRVRSMTIRKAVPVGLRAAARVHPRFAATLEAAAIRCEQEGTREAAMAAQQVAHAAADADAADADAAAGATYAYAAADAAAYAYAAYAADDAAYAAADAAAYAAAAYARDRVLSDYAEWVVEILIDMNAPGVQWLGLAPKAIR